MIKIIFTAALVLTAVPAFAQELTDITPAQVSQAEAVLPASRPYPGEDKKIKICWIKSVENNACVYKCSDGETFSQPADPLPSEIMAALPEADKKITVCWIKGVEENTCVYKCNDGRTLKQPMQQPLPGETPSLPCPQLVFPHNKAAEEVKPAEVKAEEPVIAEEKSGEKKMKACWIKKMKDGVCSYKCSDDTLLEQPMFDFHGYTGDMVPLLPCSPVVFQFGGK